MALDKGASPQLTAEPFGTVLNTYRLRQGADEQSQAFTPRSLSEHAHATVQVSVLLRSTIAAVGWQTGDGKAAGRRVRGGQTYIVPPDQPHDFRLYRPEGMVNFHIDPQALVALDPERLEAGLRHWRELSVIADPTISGIAEGVHRAWRETDGLSQLYLDAAWTMMALHLARVLIPRRDAPARAPATLPPSSLRRVIDLVEGRLHDHSLRVADLAAATNLSPVHFTRLFTRTLGVSPLQFIIDRRLERSKELLRRDTLSVAEIAVNVGFGSHTRYTEAFRKRFGRTPSAVRAGREAI